MRNIDRLETPLTVAALRAQLQTCGLAEDQTVIVHMAMSKLGFVIGGAEAVILALLAVVGESGTIMMGFDKDRNRKRPPHNGGFCITPNQVQFRIQEPESGRELVSFR